MVNFSAKRIAVGVLATGLAYACTGSGDTTGDASNAGSGQGGSTLGGVGGGLGKGFGTGGQSQSQGQGGGIQASALAITPASATLTVHNGVAPAPVKLSAVATLAGGAMSPVTDAVWSVDLGDIATVDGTGNVSAGARGGIATVKASWNGLTATATITVAFDASQGGDAVSAADKAALAAVTDANVDAAVTWLYPYDGTVFPRGLAAPTLMWSTTGPSDTYRLTMRSDFVTQEIYFTAAGPAFDPPADVWKLVTESGAGGNLDVRVARLSGGIATQVMHQTWGLGSGSLRGTVYYWAISTGRVMRIKPGEQASDFLSATYSYANPGSPQNGEQGCPSCHTVSANGNRLVMNTGVWENAGYEYSVAYDLLANKPAFTGYYTDGRNASQWALAGVSPDGSTIVENFAPLRGGQFDGVSAGAFDGTTGARLPNSGIDDVPMWMPSFSPDGKVLAYVSANQDGLYVYDWAQGGSPMATNNRKLVSGDAKTNVVQFPTVSPDHKWVIYHRGNVLGSLDDARGDLYMASVDAPGDEHEIKLANLDGDAYPFGAGDRDRHQDFEPTFLPVAAGGYYWVVFHSRRTFGNKLTGVAFAGHGRGTKQLWVAAIDINPTPGKDPSHAPFWLPGQDIGTLNMRGYWSLDPCRANGESCSAASECCSGGCVAGASGSTCSTPPGQSCVPSGGMCKTASDCCGAAVGYQCINDHCTEPVAAPH